MNNALQDRPMFKNFQLQWTVPETPACRRCGDKNHTGKDCPIKSNNRQKVLNEPKFRNLARLYERKHVPISTPANFGGISWTQVVKRSTHMNPNEIPKQNNQKQGPNNSLEERLTKMEVAINKILNHLQLNEQNTQAKTGINNTPTEETNEPYPETKKNKGKETEPINLLEQADSPITTIDSIIKSNIEPERKIENLSIAFTKYHTETELRIMHLENNVFALLAKFGQDSETEMDNYTYHIS
jgi:hypothetical protein